MLKYQINNWITCTNLQRKGKGPESFMTIWKMYFHISSGRLAHKTPFFTVPVDIAGFSLLCLLSPLLCFFLFLFKFQEKKYMCTSTTCMYECMFVCPWLCLPSFPFTLGPLACDSVRPWSVHLFLIQDDLRWILLYSEHFKHYEEIYNYTKQHY